MKAAHSPSCTPILILLAALCLPAYLASVGPAAWCRDRKIISHGTYVAVYLPVGLICDYVPVLGPALLDYLELWTPPQVPPRL